MSFLARALIRNPRVLLLLIGLAATLFGLVCVDESKSETSPQVVTPSARKLCSTRIQCSTAI
jgi:hypothetical protein